MWNTIEIAGKAIGAIAGIIACGSWLAAMTLPDSGLKLSGLTLIVSVGMIFLAIFAVIASLRGHGVPLLVIFFASFFPVGLYLIGAPHPLKWVGVSNLGFLVAGLLIWRARKYTINP